MEYRKYKLANAWRLRIDMQEARRVQKLADLVFKKVDVSEFKIEFNL